MSEVMVLAEFYYQSWHSIQTNAQAIYYRMFKRFTEEIMIMITTTTEREI
jgi:hypothetical protein